MRKHEKWKTVTHARLGVKVGLCGRMAGGHLRQGGQGSGHDAESRLARRNQPVRSRRKSIEEKRKIKSERFKMEAKWEVLREQEDSVAGTE